MFIKLISVATLSVAIFANFAVVSKAQNSQAGYVESIVKNLSCGADTITVNGWSSSPSVHLYLNTKEGQKYITETTPSIERGLPNGGKGFSITVNGSGLGATPGPKIGWPVAYVNQASTMQMRAVGGNFGGVILNPTSTNIITKNDADCLPSNTQITNYATTTANWDWGTNKWITGSTGGSPMVCSQTGAMCDKLLAGVQNRYVFMWKYDYTVLPKTGSDPVSFVTKNLPDANVKPNPKGIEIKTTFAAYCNDNSSVINSYACPKGDWKWVYLDESGNLKSSVGVFPQEILKWKVMY